MTNNFQGGSGLFSDLCNANDPDAAAARHREQFDALAILIQLGIVPPLGG